MSNLAIRLARHLLNGPPPEYLGNPNHPWYLPVSPRQWNPSTFNPPAPPLRPDEPISTPNGNCPCYKRLIYNEHPSAFGGVLTVAMLVVTLAALLSGLTLAVCGLDASWLEVLGSTGSERQRKQARAVSRIKSHSTWFLCSTLLLTIISIETLPLLITLLFGTSPLPALLSAICITLFAELLPQYIIPRQALQWSYHCRWLIWACMFLTSPLTWPLSQGIDAIKWTSGGMKVDGPPAGRRIKGQKRNMYDHEQLGALIRLHESAELHGGPLSCDASRVMRGALSLDNKALNNLIPSDSLQLYHSQHEAGRGDEGEDEERAQKEMWRTVLVPWDSVKYVHIDEPVTESLITRIKRWQVTRIPVVGEEEERGREVGDSLMRLFGVLHVKNLIAIELSPKWRKGKVLLVRDLPLYPLPIVRDNMKIYDLLNIFQMGMSRIAIVIQAPTETNPLLLPSPDKPVNTLAGMHAALSFSTANLHEHLEKHMLADGAEWTTDLVGAAHAMACTPGTFSGIRCPEPIGIVTFEDIVDALLQQRSRDEKDYFDERMTAVDVNVLKRADLNTIASPSNVTLIRRPKPEYDYSGTWRTSVGTENPGTLRKRNKNGHSDTLDTDLRIHEREFTREIKSAFGLDGADERSTIASADDKENGIGTDKDGKCDRSSYTENSAGGFHSPAASFHSSDRGAGTEKATSSETPRLRGVKRSMNGRNRRSITDPSPLLVLDGNNDIASGRQSSESWVPSYVPSVAPSVRQSCDVVPAAKEIYRLPSIRRSLFESIEETKVKAIEKIDEIVTGEDIADTRMLSADSATPPPEVDVPPTPLTTATVIHTPIRTSSSEHTVTGPSMPEAPTAAHMVKDPVGDGGVKSMTLPRLKIGSKYESGKPFYKLDIRLREESFHDDRRSLPSQVKKVGSNRSSGAWV